MTQPDLLPVTLDDMIAEIERELEYRENLYPRMKEKTTSLAIHNRYGRRMDVMRAVRAHLMLERAAAKGREE